MNFRATDMFKVLQEINKLSEVVAEEPTEKNIQSLRESLANLNLARKSM
jgi:hypothetical protein